MNTHHKIQEEILNTIKNDYRNGAFPEDEEADEDDGLDYPADEG